MRKMWLVACAMLLLGCDARETSDARPAGSLRLGAVLTERAEGADFRRATAPASISLPGDHGAHPAYRSEWWYLTANVRSRDGRRFGIQFTIFRQALAAGGAAASPWALNQVYMAHFAVSDAARRRHVAFERFARGHPRLAHVTSTPFAAEVDGWSMAATNTADAFAVAAAAADTAVGLAVVPLRPAVLQGERGLSRKGPDNASYYYSFTRMAVDGTLTVDGERLTVAGLGWFDHEWSTSTLGPHQIGWDWFALQLDDGRDLMVYQIRRDDGRPHPYDGGVVVDDAGAHVLRASDFDLAPVAWWRDSEGTAWPVEWVLRLGNTEEFGVVAVFDDQLMDTSIRYWEGMIDVVADGRAVGRGYMELTGYGS